MFPLQRLGAEVWAINTVQFSNHTGYGAWTGHVATGGEVAALVDGIAARGVLPNCDAVLSGYVGDEAIGAAILDAVARVRAANPQAVYCCDPVIGDTDTGVYVRPGIPEFLRAHALPQADIATPNQFGTGAPDRHSVQDPRPGEGSSGGLTDGAPVRRPALRAGDQPRH